MEEIIKEIQKIRCEQDISWANAVETLKLQELRRITAKLELIESDLDSLDNTVWKNLPL